MEAGDPDCLERFKSELLNTLGTGDLLEAGVRLMVKALEGDFGAYSVHSSEDPIVAFVSHPRIEKDQAIDMLERINRHIGDHPVLRHWIEKDVTLRSNMISDFIDRETYRSTKLYQEAYQELGVEFQIAIRFADDFGNPHIFMYTRRESDFSERDRAVLDALYPAFMKAIKCNQLVGERLNQLHSAVRFTARENDCLFWLSEGKSNPEIAAILGISARTVDKHCERLYRKLGFSDRASVLRLSSSLKLSGFSQLLA